MRHGVTRTHPARRRLTAMVAAGTFPFLLLAACGGDDDAAVDTTATTVDDAAADTTTTTVDDAEADTTTTTVDEGPDDTDDAGDDSDDGATDGAGDASDVDPRYAEYCDLAREINEQDDFPSETQLQALRDAAPDEIRADVEYVVDIIMEAEDEQAVFALFGDPDFASRIEPIDRFEAESCGIDFGPEAPDGVSFEIDPDATRVDVSATEYDFEFDAPPAGPVSFVMSNDGEEPHFLGIGKLLPGVTVEEAINADDPSEVVEWTAESEVAMPGEEAVLTFENLEPGEYGMVCFIPTPDGVPHAHEGMAVEFTVG